MAYCTTLEAVNASGLKKKIVDENIGTGDSSEKDFDLDNDNIISGSYTLYHAPATGDTNDMTDLTETTDYSLDKDSGRILLTATGVTALGTDILYGKYTYIENITDDNISDLIDRADDEVDELTGRKWDSPTTVTEYFDGKPRAAYPTTNAPYAQDDYRPEKIVLTNGDVTQIEHIYFLSTGNSISQAWNFDADSSTYTDITDNANDTEQDNFNLFAATPASGDFVYIGLGSQFLGANFSLNTLGVGGSVTWAYWDGSTWASFTPTDIDSGASAFTASGRLSWSPLSNWDKTTVNSSSSLYFIRAQQGVTGFSTTPIAANITADDVIGQLVSLRDIAWESWGEVTFINKNIPFGTRNIRFDYKYGSSTTPNLITELSAILTSIRMYVEISGGSYDDATSFQLGSKQVGVGEAWVNIKNVISEAKARKKEILDLLGRRADITVI